MTQNSTSSRSRIQILDIIRGIAVLGILGVNIWYFAFPEILSSGLPVTDPDKGAGYWIGIFSEIFLSGKMRSLFALLFGISSIIVLENLTQKFSGQKVIEIYYRRLLWLLIFGQIHSFFFLFPGDVLFHYAVVGMLAYPILKAPNRVRVLLMLICLLTLTLKPYLDYENAIELKEDYTVLTQEDYPPEDLSKIDKDIIEEWEDATRYISPRLYDYQYELDSKTGGYLSTFDFIKDKAIRMATYDLYNWYFWEILLYMLLGVSLFQTGFFSEDYPKRKLIQLAVLGLSLGFSLHLWIHISFYDQFNDYIESLWYLIFFDLGRLPMVLGYLALFCLLFRLKAVSVMARWLAGAGRMTLTNYLMQSFIAMVLFYILGLFNQLNRVQLALVVVGIWVLQILLSNLWLCKFSYGPLEWIWRCLTYGSLQKIVRRP